MKRVPHDGARTEVYSAGKGLYMWRERLIERNGGRCTQERMITDVHGTGFGRDTLDGIGADINWVNMVGADVHTMGFR